MLYYYIYSFLRMKSTIVTAYFQLPVSKTPHAQYVVWMRNMLVIRTPMVIFTDVQSQPLIQSLRPASLPTHYIVLTFEEFYTYRYDIAFNEHVLLDHESSIGHNTRLYQIWNEKAHFLKRAADLDPFGCDYFLWVDIGCFRHTNVRYLNWPNPSKIDRLEAGKMLMVQVCRFTADELQVCPFTADELTQVCRFTADELTQIRRFTADLDIFDISKIPSFQYTNRIGGSMFGGTKGAVDKWHTVYYQMMDAFISAGRFVGKDQSVMNSIYLVAPHLVQLVSQLAAPKPNGKTSDWFFLHEFLK